MKSKKTVYNISSNLILQIVVLIYGLVIPKIIIEKFGSDVNGLISSISQFLGYIALLESGFGPVVKSILYKPLAKKDTETIVEILRSAQKFFRKIAGIFILYIIALTLFYPMIINNQFDKLFTTSLIIIISLSTFAEYFFGITYSLYLQAEQKNYVISIIQIITYIISIAVILFLIKLNCSIHLIKLATAIIFILRPFLQKIYVEKKCGVLINKDIKDYDIKNKWDGLAQHIAWVIHSNTDIAILTIFTTLKEVSVYAVYLLVINGIKSIIQALSSGIDALFGKTMVEDDIKQLNKKFDLYETIYYTTITIICTCTMYLIVPFIKIYTIKVTDINYIRYLFGYLIVISEYIWAIRLPYSTITLAAGHFKQTKKGAWVEALTNIIISIILVIKYGIIGVTIGTIVAMTIRTIEFMYHTNKYILKRKNIESIKKILIITMETILIISLCNLLPNLNKLSYINWIINAFITFIISSAITITINCIFYKKEYKELLEILKNILKRKKA